MYPSQFRLPEVTAHLLALLERRRKAFSAWDSAVERKLADEASVALSDVERQFHDVADDPVYFERLTRSLQRVALPRYLRLAREQHALESSAYGFERWKCRKCQQVVGIDRDPEVGHRFQIERGQPWNYSPDAFRN